MSLYKNLSVDYEVLNVKTRQVYISSSKYLSQRLVAHFNQSKKSNSRLFNSLIKYGYCSDCFKLIIFETLGARKNLTQSILISTEDKYLETIPRELQVNFCPSASSTLGFRHSK